MFQIGEFSKIARVSKRLLHYYDEIGLLRPVNTDTQTGYRYYSAKQLPHLNRILVLKDLGLTLDQVARMLDGEITDDEIRGMLMMKKAEIERELQEDLQRFRGIESRLQQIQNRDEAPDIIVKSVPEQMYLSTRKIMPAASDMLALTSQMLNALPAKVGARTMGPLTVIMHSDGFEMENFDVEVGFVLNDEIDGPVALSDEHTFNLRRLPGVETMATVVHVGDVSGCHISCGVAAGWIEANGYRIAGQQRELIIEFPYPGKESEAVVEIQFPIERRSATNELLPKFAG